MKKAFVILLCVLLGLSVALNFYQYEIRIERYEDIVSDTITVYDTIPYIKPNPTDSTLLGYVTAKLPVSVPKLPKYVLKFPESIQKSQDSVENFGKSVPKYDEEVNFPIKIDNKGNSPEISTNFPDSVNVQIPITQKVYEDSTYKAYISGYNASLDSFYIYPQTKIVTIKEKPKRWHLSVSAGYGITPKGLQPCLMVGVSYMIFSF